jgi:radical SAM protein with 4Fe4S-binding SPASM domain
MQPRTKKHLSNAEINRLKKSLSNKSIAKHQRKYSDEFAFKLPKEVSLQLTNSCNLNCVHCFQQSLKPNHNVPVHLNVDILEKVLLETESENSSLYLWGGEPLLHHNWGNITSMLNKHKRWTVICTNGIMIEERLDSIIEISSNLALLISLDGLKNHNNIVRGEGTFERIVQNVQLLLDLKRKGIYKGEVSINCVINNENIDSLFEFAEYIENIGVNTLYLCLPWHISNIVASKMDDFVEDKLIFIKDYISNSINTRSWHSFNYRIDADRVNILKKELQKLLSKEWEIRIRIVPNIQNDLLVKYVDGEDVIADNISQCLAISSRMEVRSDGMVTSCRHFPEFIMGDLNTDSVQDVWNSSKYNEFRKIISNNLMPICSKCGLLYLYGI